MLRRYLGASFIAAVSVLSYLSSLSLIASVQDRRGHRNRNLAQQESREMMLSGPMGLPAGEHRRKLVRRQHHQIKKNHPKVKHRR